jgi:hypothetical protein
MGADFARKAAKTFERSWDNGRVALATADLRTRPANCGPRAVAAEILAGVTLSQGEFVTVERSESALIARRGLTEVAQFNSPPPELVSAVDASCGVAKGTVEQIHEMAGVAEISLC